MYSNIHIYSESCTTTNKRRYRQQKIVIQIIATPHHTCYTRLKMKETTIERKYKLEKFKNNSLRQHVTSATPEISMKEH